MADPKDMSVSNAPEPAISDEKVTFVPQTDLEDFGKANLHIDDEAGDLAAKALASGPAEADISRRVLKKIDLFILPFLCITYGMSPTGRDQMFLTDSHRAQVYSSWIRPLWDTPVSLDSSLITI